MKRPDPTAEAWASPEDSGSPTRGLNRISGITIAVLLVMFSGVFIVRPWQFLADDTFFYLQVAWNFARGMGSTFNTIMPTNGYHPVWMLLCAGVYKLLPSRHIGIHGIAVLVTIFDVLMLWTVRRIAKLVASDLWILPCALLIPFSFQSQLGTEGALSGFVLSLLMLYAWKFSETPTWQLAFVYSLISALAVLSRLDNIFIISFVWIAVWISLSDEERRSGRRMQLAMIPVHMLFWGSYLASNWIWFHTLQPISGVMKSYSDVSHSIEDHFPHTAWIAMMVILVCLPMCAWKKRDRFFWVVEIPFFFGVICHAAYIVLRMSTETRWTWYYTSWILLAGVLMARAGSVLLAGRQRLIAPVTGAVIVLLCVSWFISSYEVRYNGPSYIVSPSFTKTLEKNGITSAFITDQPGMLAYYSDIKLIPLDGLMGTIKFQQDLGRKGILELASEYGVKGFIGPWVPFDKAEADHFCEQLFLASSKMHCIPNGPEHWQVTGVDIYSRVPAAPAGSLKLNPDQIIWKDRGYITVWKIVPEPGQQTNQIGSGSTAK